MYTVQVILTVGWGYNAGKKFKPQALRSFDKLWKAKVYRCWMAFWDARPSSVYEIVDDSQNAQKK